MSLQKIHKWNYPIEKCKMLHDEEDHDILYIISTVTELKELQFNGLSVLLGCVDKKHVNDEFRAEL